MVLAVLQSGIIWLQSCSVVVQKLSLPWSLQSVELLLLVPESSSLPSPGHMLSALGLPVSSPGQPPWPQEPLEPDLQATDFMLPVLQDTVPDQQNVVPVQHYFVPMWKLCSGM